MSCRLPFLLMMIVTATSLAGSQPVPNVTVHEWGTFTSIAGADGNAVEWLPLEGPTDLPSFVDRSCFTLKGSLPGTVRMETPVIYFYAPRPTIVNVSVEFRRGMVTEWFPRAAVTPSTTTSSDLRRPGFTSTIRWTDVNVLPGSEAVLPVERDPSHYYAARQTDASPVQLASEREKFLFYRGVGAFQPPIVAAVMADGQIAVRHRDGDAIGDIVLFGNRGGAIAYAVRHVMTSETTVDLPAVAVDDEGAGSMTELETLLAAHGLYPAEARAMIDTWRDSWFEEGMRLFYLVDRKAIDSTLPLAVNPAPQHIERVFVGRIELVNRETIDAVQNALIKNDRATLTKFRRFLQPIAGRIVEQSTPADRVRLLELLRSINAAWSDDRSSRVPRCTQS